ncbi:hypothetical protein ACHAXR_012569 [Thalassiosira sp. AJA248-18]
MNPNNFHPNAGNGLSYPGARDDYATSSGNDRRFSYDGYPNNADYRGAAVASQSLAYPGARELPLYFIPQYNCTHDADATTMNPNNYYPSAGNGLSYPGTRGFYPSSSMDDHRLSYAGYTNNADGHRAAAASQRAAYAASAYAASSAFAAASSLSAYASSLSSSADFSSDDEIMPWETDNWVPTTKSGKQKTPNMVRNELQRYIDQCKADGTSNQTCVIETMGVNTNTFRKFMDPGTYKNQWSATQNGTYWAGAKLLARVAYEKELAKMSGKRKSAASSMGSSSITGEDAPRKKSRVEMNIEALEFFMRINSVQGVREGVVYDTCPQLVTKIKAFLQRDGMTKSLLLSALGDINSNSLNTFLSGKNQDQCGNVTYREAYVFFEKLRILEGKSRSAARLRNEREHPYGVSQFLLLCCHFYCFESNCLSSCILLVLSF